MPGDVQPSPHEKRGRKRPREPPQESAREEAAFSAQTEEREHGNHDDDQTDDVDDGIHGGNSSGLKTPPLCRFAAMSMSAAITAGCRTPESDRRRLRRHRIAFFVI